MKMKNISQNQYTQMTAVSFVCYLLFQMTMNQGVEAFVISTSKHNHSSIEKNNCIHSKKLTSVFNSSGDYDMDELLRVSQDPKLFEEYVLKKKKEKDQMDMKEETNLDDSNENEEKKSRYVPIEEWDEKRSKDDLSWEERVQFDGQRFGNQFAQNEILRKNLKSW